MLGKDRLIPSKSAPILLIIVGTLIMTGSLLPRELPLFSIGGVSLSLGWLGACCGGLILGAGMVLGFNELG